MSRPTFPGRVMFLLLSVCFASLALAAKKTCNVLEYGAKADNSTDIGPPLMKAFEDCRTAATGLAEDTVILIPKGDYSVQTHVHFRSGKALTFRFEGNLHLAFNPEAMSKCMQEENLDKLSTFRQTKLSLTHHLIFSFRSLCAAKEHFLDTEIYGVLIATSLFT
ncbi:hypothetical protein VP01_1690g4 [Puccinia sorghi]|uniref:Pectate lyase superfamily protein domain-containing protein n=1 Tax=Puccinia sorghi TaxID=27349 RepID=A0A0L6VFU8_9BASI|nr:hypothetical protein VP01_1690g4 [Puccinia sorghi]